MGFRKIVVFSKFKLVPSSVRFFYWKIPEKEEDIRRITEEFFKLPHGSLKAEPTGIQFGQGDLINGKIGGVLEDPFAAADIHDCDRRFDELRGER